MSINDYAKFMPDLSEPEIIEALESLVEKGLMYKMNSGYYHTEYGKLLWKNLDTKLKMIN